MLSFFKKRNQKKEAVRLAKTEAEQLAAKGQIALDKRLAPFSDWAVISLSKYRGKERTYRIEFFLKRQGKRLYREMFR